MDAVELVALAVLFVGNATFDLWLVATRAGRQSLERFKAWFRSDESAEFKGDLAKYGAEAVQPALDEVRTGVDAALRTAQDRITSQVEGRVVALGESLSERVGALGSRLDGALAEVRADLTSRTDEIRGGLSGEVASFRRALEERLSSWETKAEADRGRVPDSLREFIHDTLSSEVKAMEARQRAEYASEVNEMQATIRAEIEAVKADPKVAANPQILARLSQLPPKLMPKRMRKYLEQIEGLKMGLAALSGQPVGPSYFAGQQAPTNGGSAAIPPPTAPPPPPAPRPPPTPPPESPPVAG